MDANGSAWIANPSPSGVPDISKSGTLVTWTNGSLSSPIGVAVDGLGNVWVANQSGNTVTELTNGGRFFGEHGLRRGERGGFGDRRRWLGRRVGREQYAGQCHGVHRSGGTGGDAAGGGGEEQYGGNATVKRTTCGGARAGWGGFAPHLRAAPGARRGEVDVDGNAGEDVVLPPARLGGGSGSGVAEAILSRTSCRPSPNCGTALPSSRRLAQITLPLRWRV